MGSHHQNGYVFKKGGSWFVRYRDTVVEPDGSVVRKQIARRIASSTEFKSKKAIKPLVVEYLFPMNTTAQPIEATTALGRFADTIYLPYVHAQLRPSTASSYQALWHRHLAPRCGEVGLRDFRTVDAQRLLSDIGRQTKLTRTTLKHVKALLSSIFKHAKRQGLLNGINPIQDCSVPTSRASAETYAYSLAEIARMMSVLSEPAVTIVAIAAFTGLRKGEIRGLRWEDLRDGCLYVNQSVWKGHVSEPKTRSSKAPVPLVAPLVRLLERHRERVGPATGLMFRSERGTPLNLDNLAVRILKPAFYRIGLDWHGYHAFRRGLATNLYSLNVPDKVIQQILRHSQVSTTMNIYVKTASSDAVKAMKVLQGVCGDSFDLPSAVN